MGWSLGYDRRWDRDIGYGVPAICDNPTCDEPIDRGLSYVCGGEPYGGDCGCGLYFCDKHLRYGRTRRVCTRCYHRKSPFGAKPDTREWLEWKLTDPSWEEWRKANPEQVHALEATLASPNFAPSPSSLEGEG